MIVPHSRRTSVFSPIQRMRAAGLPMARAL
jgi:hypothetical protein